jgi:GNAT superfamily N-acetyltransferase
MLNLCLNYLDWDSEQLGVRCGLIDATKIEYLPEPNVLTGLVKKLVEEKRDIEFVTIKLSKECLRTVNALVQIGGVLIDTELTFIYSKGLEPDPKVVSNNYKLDFCEEVDSRPFLPLAEEMRFSRFFLDPKISNDKAIALWEASIRNHCEGFADQLLVAHSNNEPCGIVTLRFDDSSQIGLHIVGVVKKHQRKGLGRLMLNKIIERYGEDNRIYTETQSINVPAQRVYRKAGFEYHSLKYVLHYWGK